MKRLFVLLVFLASPVFASWPTLTAPVNVPMDVSATGQIVPKVGGQYSIDGIRVTATAPDAITIKRTASIAVPAATAAGGKLIAQVGQYASIARPALVAGVKGLVRGPVASIAGTMLFTYMVDLGWKWMESANSYYLPRPVYSEGFDTSYSPCKGKGYNLDQLISCANAAAFNSYGGLVKPSSYPYNQPFVISARDNSSMGIWVTAYRSQTGTKDQPATDADIDKLVLDFIAADSQRAIDFAKDKQLPLPIAPVSNPPFEASPQSQESPASQPSTTQSTAADGTITRTDCTDSVIVSFAPDGTMTNNQIKRCTTTITLPDGTVKPGGTTITGTPIAPPVAGTGTETKPPAITCDQLGNCDWAKDSTLQGIRDQLAPGQNPVLDALEPDPNTMQNLQDKVVQQDQFDGPIGQIIRQIGLPVSGGQCSLERTLTIWGRSFTIDMMPVSLCSPYHAVINWFFWGLVALYGWSRIRNFTGYRAQ